MNLTQLRSNPIVEIFRQEGMSFIETQKAINEKWNVPPEGFPMNRIESAVRPYLLELQNTGREVVNYRKTRGLPCSRAYLQARLKISPKESQEIFRTLAIDFYL